MQLARQCVCVCVSVGGCVPFFPCPAPDANFQEWGGGGGGGGGALCFAWPWAPSTIFRCYGTVLGHVLNSCKALGMRTRVRTHQTCTPQGKSITLVTGPASFQGSLSTILDLSEDQGQVPEGPRLETPCAHNLAGTGQKLDTVL